MNERPLEEHPSAWAEDTSRHRKGGGRRRAWLALAAVAALLAAGGVFAWLGVQQWREDNPGAHRLQTTWRAVRHNPHNATAWAALGDAQAAMDQLEAAEQSYRTAIALGGNVSDASVMARLGFQLYARGEDVAALDLLERAEAAGADVPMLSWTIERLRQQAARPTGGEANGEKPAARRDGDPDRPATTGSRSGKAQGTEQPEEASLDRRGTPTDAIETREARADKGRLPCEVPLSRPHRRAPYHIPVRVGAVETELILDTGASITALAETLLLDLGVPIRHDRPLHAITATGPAQMPTAVVERIEVGGRSAVQHTVAACDGCGGQHAEGLFGLDLQASLGLELDLARSRVRFADCAD